MADFNTHILGATVVVSLGATCSTKLLDLGVSDGLMLTLVGVIGGILPDIDLKQSQPSRVLFSVLGIVAALAGLFTNILEYSAFELWLGAVLIYCVVRYPLWWLFHTTTTHRGALHSIAAAFMFGVLIAALSWQFLAISALQSWLLAIFMTSGYLIHLALDEIYSVDFSGVKIRRSFGSALKPLDFDKIPASCLILFITGFAWFWTAPYSEAWSQWLTYHTDWQTRLLPEWILNDQY